MFKPWEITRGLKMVALTFLILVWFTATQHWPHTDFTFDIPGLDKKSHKTSQEKTWLYGKQNNAAKKGS